ncbi:nucleolar [Halobacteriales archaeon QS_6_71_20]|nr:MAG: nucleolar [Halobacteriales archaeon QS_6_71_20]
MTESDGGRGWFERAGSADPADAAETVTAGTAEEPRDWPALAVERGYVDAESEYYDRLREATTAAARAAAAERERADDRQLLHAVRAMDDAERVANELAERVAEWAGTLFPDAGTGVEGCLDLAERDPDGPVEERVVSLASRVADLDREADELRAFIESRAPVAAPNLASMAGPVLAARLISLAGGLETLAKKPSGTLQVLGAEDALFAHLRGHGSSPKHGVIYTHEYVRGTRPEDRGSASRALAGKLTIAARIDHYAGDRRPELEAELNERIRTIRARAEDGDAGGDGGGSDE